MKKIILITTSALIGVISLGWFVNQPSYESLIGILASIAGISSSLSESTKSGKISDLDSLISQKVWPPAKKITRILYVATVLCFFLPFITVSCTRNEEVETTTYSGIQIAFDGIKNISSNNLSDTSSAEERNAQSSIGVAFLVAIIGIVTSFSTSKFRKVFSALTGGTGAVLLFRSKLLIEALRDEYTDFRFEIGFWLVLFFFIIAFVVYLPLPIDDA